ncbi:Small subunit processome component 20-like protein [Rhynchospora pubera]|uniref:Small subunit processome component 20-like protein n=1 Tax=Rhynchospora pubera TaxID=906938 RepID=A0AAV8H4Y2_9POAL|nr:Small subunit processome component 20-like protein [Rhynchospora pubera]
MANSNTASVKSLDTSGRKNFVFKSASKRIQEIKIDVYRNLAPVKSEPSSGSFFRDALIEWRELNTTEDFVSFYNEMMPLVQTLPQIILHREKIFSELIKRLNMEAPFSLQPILMLIADLSRDILEEFLPFLERLTKSIVDLLEKGGERDPDILEQVFTSWSYIMMYLQKYLVKDIINILKVTVRLRFFLKDHVREFMAEAISLLLRNAPKNQLTTGVKKVVREVAKRSSPIRKHGASSLLWHAMRGTSGKLHSSAKMVLSCLLDKSTLCMSEKYPKGVFEVVTGVLNRLCTEVNQKELDLMYACLFDAIKRSMESDCLEHLNYIIQLLSFAVKTTKGSKSLDKEGILKLVQLLLNKYIAPSDGTEMERQLCEVVDSLLNLLLCLLDVPIITSDLMQISPLYNVVFKLRTPSLLYFIKELNAKDLQILHALQSHIIGAVANFIEDSPDQVVFVLLRYFARVTLLLERVKSEAEGGVKKLFDFFTGNLGHWTKVCNDLHGVQVCEDEAALLWGVITCYPRLCDSQDSLPLMRNLISSLNQLLTTEDGVIAGLPRATWQSLLGAALASCQELVRAHCNQVHAEVNFYLSLAGRHKSSLQVLSAVADYFDNLLRESCIKDRITAEERVNAFRSLIENLSSPDKTIRVFTLRILSHLFARDDQLSTNDERPNKRLKTGESDLAKEDAKHINVVDLLLKIETIPLSIATTRKISILLSQIQMNLSTRQIDEEHLQLVLHGVIGVLHNRFSQVWDPAMECLSLLIRSYRHIVWEKYVEYLAVLQNKALSPEDQLGNLESGDSESLDIAKMFDQFLYPESDPTPSATVIVSLLKTLQKIPDIVESRSRQLVPLFFNFLGYTNDSISSVESYMSTRCTGKDWRVILKEWLNVIKSMHNARSLFRSDVLYEILVKRLLDDADPEFQLKVLDCLLNWKEEFLVPYAQHLRNIAVSKNLSEELTTWPVSKESNSIKEDHRGRLVPLIIRLITPRIRNLKSLGSRKHAGVSHRKALIRFFMQFEPTELELFFSLLLKPLLPQPLLIEILNLGKSLDSVLPEVSNSIAIDRCSWKRKNGFLHVVEDVLDTFDMAHMEPYLDLVLKIVVLILESCMRNINRERGEGDTMAIDNPSDDCEGHASTEQYKELRSLCFRVIYLALNNFEAYNIGSEFWDIFFTSIRPLVDRFKLEGASSEKPSSLFTCFIVMSKSPKLVSLLARESNLVPTVFSVLSVSTASDKIVSAVLEFVENLLKLDSDLDLDGEYNPAKEVLLPHVDVLVQSLHDLYKMRSELRRKSVVVKGRRELRVFKILARYIKDSVVAENFLDILLPLFRKKGISSDECMEGLQVVREMVPILGSELYDKILGAVNPLLVTACLDLRMCICKVVNGLTLHDSSFSVLARLLCDLNAISTSELGELDYDTRIKAYDSVESQLFWYLREEQAMTVLSHCVFDMSSEELIFRQSASRALQSFLQFAAPILNGDGSFTGNDVAPVVWKKASVMQIVERIYLHHMGDAMSKDVSVQKEWFALLREMVYNFRNHPLLNSFSCLCSEDPDHDFFVNIVHLQIHRRVKALSLFRKKIGTATFSEGVTVKIFVPLLFNMLFDVKEMKGENLKNACVETLASIAAHVQWESYRAILGRCFHELTRKSDKQKMLLRLICSILDSFHFFDDSVITEKIVLENKRCYLEKIARKAQKLSSQDSEKVNVNASLVALKILKLLPVEVMKSQLSTIVHRICTFLKNRLQSIRDEARSALAACLKELGIEFLHFVVKILRTILKRGYELHVLGYTLNFLLSSIDLSVGGRIGQLDYCLEELLEVVETDIFGEVSEEKEVEKIASKMKETNKSMSYETLRLVCNNITFRTQSPKLLSPICAWLTRHLSPKLKARIEMALHNIALGIESNPSAEATLLFHFVYRLVQDTITQEESKSDLGTDLNLSSISNPDIIAHFALGLFCNRLKKIKLGKEDENLLSMLEPFIPLLAQCLSSKYESVISSSFKCLTQLIALPLPSIERNAENIKTSLLEICCRSNNSSSPLMKSCLSLLSVLLNKPRVRVTLSDEELRMILSFPVFIDLQTNPSPVALSLLKAIVGRKLVVPEIYDMVTIVGELMVTSQDETVRKQCSKILLQFLLDYRLSEKRLKQHMDFLLVNLSYEHPSGKGVVLEILHAIMMKFPKSIIDSQAEPIFLHLVATLSNEKDSQIISIIATIFKVLIDHTSESVLNSIMNYCISWYTVDDHCLWSAAAQVLGLLAETLKKGFRKQTETVIRVARHIMESSLGANSEAQVSSEIEAGPLFWIEAYHSLAMLGKVFIQFPDMYYKKEFEDIWILVTKFLLHPYNRLREISTHLVASYFKSVFETRNKDNNTKAKRSNSQSFILVSPSRLFVLSVSLISQLRRELERGAETNGLILNNISFSVCELHFFATERKLDQFWLSLSPVEQRSFLEGFELLGSRKAKNSFLLAATASSEAEMDNQSKNNEVDLQSLLVVPLIKLMGKIAMQMEDVQMDIVFKSFGKIIANLGQEESLAYAYHILFPLYKVCEGFAGKVTSDDIKQLAGEVRDRIKDVIGVDNFVQLYNQIRRSLKRKRESRKQAEKVLAVVNPTRHAKRKIRIASKHREHKKRKIMGLKMGRWGR